MLSICRCLSVYEYHFSRGSSPKDCSWIEMLKYGLWQRLLDLLRRMVQASAAPTESSAASPCPSLHLAAFPCRLLSRTQCRPDSPSYDSYVHIHISYILLLWLASEEVVSLLRLLQGPKLSKVSGSLTTTPVEARDGNKSTTLTYLYLTNLKLLKLGSIANLRPVRLVPTQHPAFDLPTGKIMDVRMMQAATLNMSVHEQSPVKLRAEISAWTKAKLETWRTPAKVPKQVSYTVFLADTQAH